MVTVNPKEKLRIEFEQQVAQSRAVGDILNFFNKMDNDMKTTTDMSLQEQDELCRKAGFPTITEQKAHWNTKELEAVDKAQLVQAVEAMAVFLDQMNKAIGTFREALNRLTK